MSHHNGGTSGDYCSQCGQTWEDCAYNGCERDATYDGMTEGLERLIDVLNDPYGELEGFEGIETLLRDDRARAQKLWYPVNPDGTFNR